MFHDYCNSTNTFVSSSPSQLQQQRQQHAFLNGPSRDQAWSPTEHCSSSSIIKTDDSGLSSSQTPRLSPLPANHKRPHSASDQSSSTTTLSPRPPPPTRRLPKQPPRKQPPVPEFAKAFLRAWFSKNHKDPSLSDGDKKALAQLTELSEEQVAKWVNIERAREVTTEYSRCFLSDSAASTPFMSSEARGAFGTHYPSALGIVPSTGYFTPPTPSTRLFGGHNTPLRYQQQTTTSPVAGLQSPFFNVGSAAEMQRYSALSNSSAGGSSAVFDDVSGCASKHTSTTSFYSDGSSLYFMPGAVTPVSGMAQQLPLSSSTSTSTATATATATATTTFPANDNDIPLQHQREQPNHRDRQPSLSTPTLTSPNPSDRPYRCTYGCPSTSINKSDWKRHEETHEPQKEYICLLHTRGYCTTPSTTTTSSSSSNPGLPPTISCEFCSFCLPSTSHSAMESHLESQHAVSKCLSVPVGHRTAFKRADHLAQHLKTHNMEPGAGHWKGWWRDVRPRKTAWGCGFCGGVLAGWPERVEHVGAHFKRGVPAPWDPSLAIRGLLRQPGLREAWRALLRDEGLAGDDAGDDPAAAAGLRWDDSDATAALQARLETAAAYDADILALEARKLAAPATPSSLRFINRFDFSPPSTPSTATHDAWHDYDDAITTYYGEREDPSAAAAHAAAHAAFQAFSPTHQIVAPALRYGHEAMLFGAGSAAEAVVGGSGLVMVPQRKLKGLTHDEDEDDGDMWGTGVC